MKCPKCKKEIDKVRVYSECWQWGYLKGKKIEDYDHVEELTETTAIECPECSGDLEKVIKF